MTGLWAGQSGETALTQAGDGVLTMRLNHAESAHAGSQVKRDERSCAHLTGTDVIPPGCRGGSVNELSGVAARLDEPQ